MDKPTCSIDECVKPVVARGWCRMHYGRWYTHGSTDDPTPTALERLLARYTEHPAPYDLPDPCWAWTGTRSADGYARLKVKGKFALAHRFAYESFVGAIPDGLIVRHRCDVRACINPRHLELGTHRDNAMDRTVRNRTGWRKLTDRHVAEIRVRLSKGHHPNDIAKDYGVTPGMIRHIKEGRQRTRPTLERPA